MTTAPSNAAGIVDSEIVVCECPDALSPAVAAALDALEAEFPMAGLTWYRNFVHEVRPDSGRTLRMFYALVTRGVARVVLPVAVAPAHRWPWHRDVASLANYYTPLYRPCLAADATPDEVALVLRRVRADHGPLARLTMTPMDPGSSAFALLEAGLRRAGFSTHRFFAFGNWVLPAEGLSWEDYLAGRRGKMRSDIKRMIKRLQQAGASMRIARDVSEVDQAVTDYRVVYSRSWKQDEPHEGFVPGLIRACAERGWLRLGLLHIGERPIAAQLWIVAHRRALIFKVAYDEDFKEYSPGTVLTAHLMRHVLDDEKVNEVDFLSGDDPYKRSWMSERRERYGIVAYNLRTPGGCLGAVLEVLARASRPLRQRFSRPATGAVVQSALKP